MKRLIFSVAFLALIGGCKRQQHQPTTKHDKKRVLVVQLLDFSKSCDALRYFDSTTARNLYATIASRGGGTIKLYGVYANSLRQDVLSLDVPTLDTVNTATIKNVYNKAKQVSTNRKTVAAYDAQSRRTIGDYIRAVNQPHNCLFTDLSHCLQLAKTTLEQENFSEYKKILLIGSDMVNDEQGHRHAPLQPLHLKNTTVLIVRPTLSTEKLQSLFPDSKVYVFADANDILSIIQSL